MARSIFYLLILLMVTGSVAAVEAMTGGTGHSKSSIIFAVRSYDPNSSQKSDGWATAPITTGKTR